MKNLRADYRRLAAYREKDSLKFLLETMLFDNGFQAVWLYRLAHALKNASVPILPPLLARLNIFLTGVDIAPRATIGPGLVISHGVGLVIGGYAVLGERVLLHHQVTIGAATVGRIQSMPRIGSDVVIGAGAKIIGGSRPSANHCFIGANMLVTEDVPDDTLAEQHRQEASRKSLRTFSEPDATRSDDRRCTRPSLHRRRHPAPA